MFRCPSKSDKPVLKSNLSLTLPYTPFPYKLHLFFTTTRHICYIQNLHTPSLKSCTSTIEIFQIICSFLKVNSYGSQKKYQSRRWSDPMLPMTFDHYYVKLAEGKRDQKPCHSHIGSLSHLQPQCNLTAIHHWQQRSKRWPVRLSASVSTSSQYLQRQ